MNNVINFNNMVNVKAAVENTQVTSHLAKVAEGMSRVDFPVAEQALDIRQTGIPVMSHKAIVRTDTNEVLSIVGEGYKLVENRKLFSDFERAITESDLNTSGLQRRIETSHNGARSFLRYVFPEHQVDVSGNGDKINMEIVVKNSYDGSSSFETMLGGYRLLCMNGQVVGDTIYRRKHKHTRGLNIEWTAEYLTVWLEGFMKQADEWTKYRNVSVTMEVAEKIIESYTTSIKTRVQLLQDFYKEAETLGENMWALYNALTAHSTHSKVTRNTGVDNIANARSLREESVRKVVSSKEWKGLVAA